MITKDLPKIFYNILYGVHFVDTYKTETLYMISISSKGRRLPFVLFLFLLSIKKPGNGV